MNILVISTFFNVFEQKTGGQNRVYNLIMQLAKKNRVVVLQPKEDKKDINPNPLKSYYFDVGHIRDRSLFIFSDFNIGLLLNVIKIIKIEKIDLIQVSFPFGIPMVKLATKLIGKNVPVVYDAHDVESDLIKQSIANDQKHGFLEKLLLRLYIPLQEKAAVRSADRILAVSEADKTRFIEIYKIGNEKVSVIPSGTGIVDPAILKRKDLIKNEFEIPKNKCIAIFHGSLPHFPNKEAIDIITKYLAPEMINRNIVFIIAGSNVPVFEIANIKSLGFVKDIFSLIQAADFAIVPILKGGGTRLKILDYMGVGLPIISTKKGIEGINAKNGEHAIITDDVNEQFIDAIKYLMNTEKERKRIGANARRLAEEEYDWDKIGEKLDELYRRIVLGKLNANK